jgi:CHRD domain
LEVSAQEAMMIGRMILSRWMAVALVSAGLAGCGGGSGYGSGGPANPVMVVRAANLSAVPTVTTSATGRGALVVHPTTYEIMGGGITFTGFTAAPTAARITRADNSTVVTLLLASGTSTDTATVPAGFTLSASDQALLLAGTLFFNVSTAANPSPGGEIRGAISVATGVTAGLATLNAGQEVPPTASTATGRGVIVFDNSGVILIAYATHNVSLANVAHIHIGAPGDVGAPIVDLVADGPSIYFAVHADTLTPAEVTDLKAGNTYFNVHSPNNLCPPAASCAAGEIRGQIAVQ